MRTNIVIDDDLMAEAMAVSGLNTKRETVEAALHTLIRIRRQADVLSLAGKITWDGDLDAMREGRVLHEEGDAYLASTEGEVTGGQ